MSKPELNVGIAKNILGLLDRVPKTGFINHQETAEYMRCFGELKAYIINSEQYQQNPPNDNKDGEDDKT